MRLRLMAHWMLVDLVLYLSVSTVATSFFYLAERVFERDFVLHLALSLAVAMTIAAA
jgi:hypothetical protein